MLLFNFIFTKHNPCQTQTILYWPYFYRDTGFDRIMKTYRFHKNINLESACKRIPHTGI